MFRLTALAALLSSAAALKANSSAGNTLLQKSSRSLEGNDNDNYDWLMDFSLVFQSCHKVTQYAGEDAQEGESVGYINLVKYKLCPSKNCRYGCKGAEYVTDMYSFVDAYTEWQMDDQEYQCEQARESCQCQYYYGDEEVCEKNCFTEKGMSQCIEQDEDDKFDFDLQDYLQCKQTDVQDDNGNALFVGPTCSESGQRINLGIFSDENCEYEYDYTSAFIEYYGVSLPYQSESIVAENCISCKQVEEEDGYYKNVEVTPICEESYPQSAKCESNIASYISYPSTSACEYIENIKLYEKGYKPISGAASTFFAVVFGISTVLLAGVAVHLYKMNSRKIDLQTDAAVV